ncbi:unnamed protein product [Clavelina lepadiformis]|uniref:C-type lectin domain-containing protein n=1 Tax=Clavelina lepadiformis TaxID=159417 RepID=A0ABP0FJ22_CLALP
MEARITTFFVFFSLCLGQDAKFEYNGLEYLFYHRVLNQKLAQSFCQEIGGNLIVVNNATTQRFVTQQIKELVQNRSFYILGFDGYWTSGKQTGLNRTWYWPDGTEVPVKEPSYRFMNWYKDEPEARQLFKGSANCLLIGAWRRSSPDIIGRWFSRNCNSLGYPLCETSRKSGAKAEFPSIWTRRELLLAIAGGVLLFLVLLLVVVTCFFRRRAKLSRRRNNIFAENDERAEENNYITPPMTCHAIEEEQYTSMDGASEPIYLELDDVTITKRIEGQVYENTRTSQNAEKSPDIAPTEVNK